MPLQSTLLSSSLLILSSLISSTKSFEVWVGGRDLTPTANVRLWVLNSANSTSTWADGISVGFPPIFTPNDLDALSSAGIRLLPCVHSSLDTMQRQLFQDGTANTTTFTSAYINVLPAFQAGTRNGPQPFMWWSLTEDDSSGVGFPFEQLAVPPSSHSDAWSQFDNYLQRAQILSETLMPSTPLIAQVGFAEQAHAHFARGATLALIERANDDIGDLSTAFAFARGAAKQYGGAFGIDLSWWWGVLYSGVNRLPSAYHRRHAYLSLFGGASVVNIEGGDGLCDGSGKPLPLGEEIQAFGEFVRRQGFRTGVSPQERTNPIVPVLLVLPKDHGYSTRPYWLTRNEAYGYARLPPRIGDRAIGGFFSHVFSGAGFSQDPWPLGGFASNDPPASMWALSALTSPYAPRLTDVVQSAPYIPFGTFPNRTAAASAFAASNIDPSPWRPMPDTRFGSIFDVAVTGLGLASGVLSAAPNNVFGSTNRKNNRRSTFQSMDPSPPPLPLGSDSGYRIVVLLGPINMTDELTTQLVDFAQSGGRVFLSAGVVGPSDNDLTGYSPSMMLPELRVGRAWRFNTTPPSPQQREAFRFVPVLFQNGNPPNNVSVLASTATSYAACGNAPCPLATEYAVGNGAITTILIPWFEGGDRDGLSLLAETLFDQAFTAIAPVQVTWDDTQGFPVDFLATSSRSNGVYTTVISNNDETRWVGNATVSGPDAPTNLTNCTELRSGTSINVDKGITMADIVINGFDIAVVQCSASW
jgi:hypothetical protein